MSYTEHYPNSECVHYYKIFIKRSMKLKESKFDKLFMQLMFKK